MSKKIVIYDSRYIRQFRIYGPIARPSIYDDDVIKKLIADGHSVYERLPDGTDKRLTMKDFEIPNTTTPAKTVEKPAEKPVATKVTEAVEETPVITSGEVYNGVSETTTPVMPAKEETTSTTSMTKAQRRAQKKAKLEAAKETEETTEA
jgi:hypothetical protein